MDEAKQGEENVINEGTYYLLLWISDVLFCLVLFWFGLFPLGQEPVAVEQV